METTLATALVPPPTISWHRVLAGPCLCCGIKVLKGVKGQTLSFPALHFVAPDIVRVTWMSRGTHIAEAKPREMFTVNYLPSFRGRLLIHPTNLSLEITSLELRDSGRYKAVVDTSSNPTNPKTFSYLLVVCGESKDGGRRVVGTRLGLGPPWACPHGGGLPLGELPSPVVLDNGGGAQDGRAVSGDVPLPLSVTVFTHCTQPWWHPHPPSWGLVPWPLGSHHAPCPQMSRPRQRLGLVAWEDAAGAPWDPREHPSPVLETPRRRARVRGSPRAAAGGRGRVGCRTTTAW